MVLATPNLILKLMRRLSYRYYIFLKYLLEFSLKFISAITLRARFTMWPIKVIETWSKLDESENEIKEDLNFTRAS